jgi:SAM-dependent methyltransferase
LPAADFYDSLAPFHHLIFESWDASIARQAAALESIIRAHGLPGGRTVLDVACGIGTQSLGLAALGYDVTASDLSPGAVDRARIEAKNRQLPIDFSVADMRAAYEHHGRTFDVVLCADNSLPHLLTDSDIAQAFEQFFACTRPGGLCIVSVRDYAALEQGGVQLRPYGVRTEGDARYLLFQVWEWHGSLYDMQFYIVRDHGADDSEAHVMKATYYAVSIPELLRMMTGAGFERVQRLDGVFFQPILIGVRPEPAIESAEND